MYACIYRGADESLPNQEGNNLGSKSGKSAISTTSRRQLSSSFFPARQSTEGNSRHSDRNKLACFFPGLDKDLSAHLYMYVCVCMYVFMYVCVYVCIYLCMYICMYVCMYICMYV